MSRRLTVMVIVSLSVHASAGELPASIFGHAQVYDAFTFDLVPPVSGQSRYRASTRIRLEGVEGCQLRQTAELDGVRWPCGVVGAAWLVSQTIGLEIECRPTRVLSGFSSGYYAQCFVAGADLGASGLSAGMLVRAAPEGETDLPGYAEFENGAKLSERGLWSSRFDEPADWRRANGSYNPLDPLP